MTPVGDRHEQHPPGAQYPSVFRCRERCEHVQHEVERPVGERHFVHAGDKEREPPVLHRLPPPRDFQRLAGNVDAVPYGTRERREDRLAVIPLAAPRVKECPGARGEPLRGGDNGVGERRICPALEKFAPGEDHLAVVAVLSRRAQEQIGVPLPRAVERVPCGARIAPLGAKERLPAKRASQDSPLSVRHVKLLFPAENTPGGGKTRKKHIIYILFRYFYLSSVEICSVLC